MVLLTRVYNGTVKLLLSKSKIMKFNTAIAQPWSLSALLIGRQTLCGLCQGFVQLIAPFAPHLAEELWQTVAANR